MVSRIVFRGLARPAPVVRGPWLQNMVSRSTIRGSPLSAVYARGTKGDSLSVSGEGIEGTGCLWRRFLRSRVASVCMSSQISSSLASVVEAWDLLVLMVNFFSFPAK
ncbi:hypothetical protein F2Q69_00005340 [Brassica cretica]|uniref:Uncharacterized protein n=1 Tax=Brassica cretica TaxID=69181 RepID=A0A8S9PBC8_BRACR|nr:hypothetical protein F2Q69_00005340 [Brassica cretica]